MINIFYKISGTDSIEIKSQYILKNTTKHYFGKSPWALPEGSLEIKGSQLVPCPPAL